MASASSNVDPEDAQRRWTVTLLLALAAFGCGGGDVDAPVHDVDARPAVASATARQDATAVPTVIDANTKADGAGVPDGEAAAAVGDAGTPAEPRPPGTDVPTAPPPGAKRIKILFLGNVATFSFDMPRILQALGAAAAPPLAIDVEVVEYKPTDASSAWRDNLGGVRDKVQQGGWNFVAFQIYGYEASAGSWPIVKEIIAAIKAVKAQPIALHVLYGVMDRTGKAALETLGQKVDQMRNVVSGTTAWVSPSRWSVYLARKGDATLDLRDVAYPWRDSSADLPGPVSQYIAASTLFAVVTGRSPEGIKMYEVPASHRAFAFTYDLGDRLGPWAQAVAMQGIRETLANAAKTGGIGPGYTAPVGESHVDISRSAWPDETDARRRARQLDGRLAVAKRIAATPFPADAMRGLTAAPPDVQRAVNLLEVLVAEAKGTPQAQEATRLLPDLEKLLPKR